MTFLPQPRGGLAPGRLPTEVAAMLLALLLLAQLVQTSVDPAADSNWSVSAAETVGLGNSAVAAEAGWPGVGFTYLRGVDERTDWGFHASLNYGLQGTSTSLTGGNFGLAYRHTLGGLSDVGFTLEAQPGLALYSSSGSVLFGVGLPVGVVAGFKLDERLTLDLAFEVPLLISFSNPAGVLLGPQFGSGGEYQLNHNLAVTARLRIGPEFAITSESSSVRLGFTALFGLAYNLR
jgi:hypothetical protein